MTLICSNHCHRVRSDIRMSRLMRCRQVMVTTLWWRKDENEWKFFTHTQKHEKQFFRSRRRLRLLKTEIKTSFSLIVFGFLPAGLKRGLFHWSPFLKFGKLFPNSPPKALMRENICKVFVGFCFSIVAFELKNFPSRSRLVSFLAGSFRSCVDTHEKPTKRD